MRAVLFREFGPPSVLELNESYAKPSRKKGELLVRIHATSVNPIDCKTRRGDMPRLLVAKPQVQYWTVRSRCLIQPRQLVAWTKSFDAKRVAAVRAG